MSEPDHRDFSPCQDDLMAIHYNEILFEVVSMTRVSKLFAYAQLPRFDAPRKGAGKIGASGSKISHPLRLSLASRALSIFDLSRRSTTPFQGPVCTDGIGGHIEARAASCPERSTLFTPSNTEDCLRPSAQDCQGPFLADGRPARSPSCPRCLLLPCTDWSRRTRRHDVATAMLSRRESTPTLEMNECHQKPNVQESYSHDEVCVHEGWFTGGQTVYCEKNECPTWIQPRLGVTPLPSSPVGSTSVPGSVRTGMTTIDIATADVRAVKAGAFALRLGDNQHSNCAHVVHMLDRPADIYQAARYTAVDRRRGTT
jgi:hypothetical protein